MCVTSVFRWGVSSGLACALMLVGLNPVAGQTTKRSGSSQEVRRLSLVIGGGVQIADGVAVGKIEDVVLNDRGCTTWSSCITTSTWRSPGPWPRWITASGL